MGTVNHSIVVDSIWSGRRFMVVQWATMGNGDVGTPIELPMHADRAVQVVGTFGVGGTCTIEGTLDGTNYAVLNDPQGNALAITAAKIEQILETTLKIRPSVAGDGTTSLTVTMLLLQGGV